MLGSIVANKCVSLIFRPGIVVFFAAASDEFSQSMIAVCVCVCVLASSSAHNVTAPAH